MASVALADLEARMVLAVEITRLAGLRVQAADVADPVAQAGDEAAPEVLGARVVPAASAALGEVAADVVVPAVVVVLVVGEAGRADAAARR